MFLKTKNYFFISNKEKNLRFLLFFSQIKVRSESKLGSGARALKLGGASRRPSFGRGAGAHNAPHQPRAVSANPTCSNFELSSTFSRGKLFFFFFTGQCF